MITIRYSCPACGIKGRNVQVPARETEDVVGWMQRVVAATLGDDHARLSPCCHPKSLADVMIPLPPEAEFIGQQVE